MRVVGGLDRAINVSIDANDWQPIKFPFRKSARLSPVRMLMFPVATSRPVRKTHAKNFLGRFTDPRQFGDLVVANVNGSPVRLRDLRTC